MKKLLMLTLMLILCLACAFAVQAEELKSEGYTYVVLEDGTAKITKYDGWWETSLEIPAELNGHRVTGIGEMAFAFNSSLTFISIPDSVTSIGDDAFFLCDSLTSATIPDSVAMVGLNPFFGCSKLTKILISSSHPALALVDDVLFSKAEKRLICYFPSKTESSYAIPKGIVSIGGHAFMGCSSLTSVSIPDSVTSIEDHTFDNCSNLTSVTIPDSVNVVGSNPFSACVKLTNILISPHHPALALADGVLFSKADKRLIYYLPSKTENSYAIPQGIVSIGYGAFGDCKNLTSVSIPDSVTSIGEQAFFGCCSLTSITIPDSVTSIGEQAFDYCYSLTSVTLPDSITSIGEDAFADCGGLTLTVNPGSYAEQYCKDNALPYKYPDASLDWLNN